MFAYSSTCFSGHLCNRPLGIQSGKLKNRGFSASSSWNAYHGPFLARLHRQRRGHYVGSWSAKHNNHYQWLMIDFGRATKIIRVGTQGRQDASQWVTTYWLSFSQDGVNFVYYEQGSGNKVSFKARLY